MKITFFVFSGTGNTWWAVNDFKSLAGDYMIDAEVISIENSEETTEDRVIAAINNSDIIGFAYPVYGSNVPMIMKDFIDRFTSICDANGEQLKTPLPDAMVICTMMMFSGDGAILPKNKLEKCGFTFKWGMNVPLTSNISIPIFRANPYEKEKIEENKEKTRDKFRKLLERISKGEKWLEHRWNVPFRLVALLQRVSEPLLYKLVHFGVDTERCIRCLRCVNHCPTETINYDKENDSFSFADTCTFCMRCYNLCPEHAITANDKVCLPPKYKRLDPIMKDFKFSDLHD